METTIRVMMSVMLVGLVVVMIVFFVLFGLLPAENVGKVLKGGSSTSTGNVEVVFTTTTVQRGTTTIVKKVPVERKVVPPDKGSGSDSSGSSDTSDSETSSQKTGSTEETQTQQTQEEQQTEEEDEPQKKSLPPVVFNTSGKIKEIRTSGKSLLVDSDGSHFETVPPSGVVEITVHIVDSTNILDANNNEIDLADLDKGDKISIEASENIKNSDEFEASNIKIQS